MSKLVIIVILQFKGSKSIRSEQWKLQHSYQALTMDISDVLLCCFSSSQSVRLKSPRISSHSNSLPETETDSLPPLPSEVGGVGTVNPLPKKKPFRERLSERTLTLNIGWAYKILLLYVLCRLKACCFHSTKLTPVASPSTLAQYILPLHLFLYY